MSKVYVKGVRIKKSEREEECYKMYGALDWLEEKAKPVTQALPEKC